MNRRRTAFWLLFAATLVAFVYETGASLVYVREQAGGLDPFDLLTEDYTFAQAEAFLAALSADGYAYYQSIQQPLGLLFIALYAATFFFAIQALVPARWPYRLRRMLPLLALVPAIFDLLENRAVTALVASGAGNITPDAVATASRWTMLKQDTGVPLVLFVFVLAIVRLVTIFRARASTRRA